MHAIYPGEDCFRIDSEFYCEDCVEQEVAAEDDFYSDPDEEYDNYKEELSL